MAVSTEHTKDILMGDGVNTKFPFTFQVIEPEQVKCLKVLASGEEIELLTTEYEVKLKNNGTNGGEITYPLTGNPLDAGNKLIVYRETEIKQDYTPPNGQIFDAVAIRMEIDRLTMQNQEQEESLGRSVQTSMGSGADPAEYLENVNTMLENARLLQEQTIAAAKKNLKDATEQAELATDKASSAGESKTAAAASAKSAADVVNGFDEHAATKQNAFDEHVSEKTTAFNANASEKQKNVDESAELARKYAQGTVDEMPSGSAKHWAEEARKIYNKTDVVAQSIYQERVILESGVIVLHERKCRYYREPAENEAFSIDISNINQPDMDITVDLILKMTSAVPIDLSAILPTGKWLDDNVPDFSDPGEYWIAFVSDDGGVTWRGSYEGMFAL